MIDIHQYLIQKYGPLLNTKALAEVFNYKDSATVLNAISAERFPIKTHRVGKSRVADVRDVIAYLDKQRAA